MIIEVHILQNHAPSNLNRDDTGSPKEAIFGGHRRARISSQSLKRSIRSSSLFREALSGKLATRTRSLPELVRERLLASGLSPELAGLAAKKASGFGNNSGDEQPANKSGKYRTAQTMFLSDGDIDAVVSVLGDAAKSSKSPEAFGKEKAADLQKKAEDDGYRPVAVDVALFGRMVTSEAFLDVDASSQFAHALSTHKVDHEFDYYTAVDDLERSSDDSAGGGADMIGDTEYNSACYYKYFNVHVDGLLRNLDPGNKNPALARATADAAIRALIEAAVKVTPSAKQNSFAAFQLPSLIFVEVRPNNLPVSYANAFVNPVDPKRGLVRESVSALLSEAERLTKKFNLVSTSRYLLVDDDRLKADWANPQESLNDLLDRLSEVVNGG